jgi:excinuclease ABC subunit C
MDVPHSVKAKLAVLPDRPGCYLMRDRRGRIIYVGKAASLRKRVPSYFRDAALRSASPKLRGLVRSVGDLEWIVTRSEAEALLTEGRLIKDFRPRYNVSFRDDKRFLLLRVDPGEPWPRFDAVRIQREDSAAYFGPYVSSAATRATLEFVDKRFGLRRCPPREPGPADHRHCLNDIVRYCAAPCLGRADRAEYAARVEEACAFLRGERPRYLLDVQVAMEDAAQTQDFERAAALRDTLLMLRATVSQRTRVAGTPVMRADEARQGVAELREALGLPRLPRRIECYDVSTISGTHAVASLVCAADGLPHRHRYRRYRIRTARGLDDAAMMAEVIARRFSRLRREGGPEPDLVLVDGGPVQVRAAEVEIRRAGFREARVAGLAKRHETLYLPGSNTPVDIRARPHALQVLQRVRDEAHRFALLYHRRLRAQRIRESVINEIPGIGPRRRALLLQHFGSVARLRRAPEDEIAAVPGIGRHIAHEIKERLSPAPHPPTP